MNKGSLVNFLCLVRTVGLFLVLPEIPVFFNFARHESASRYDLAGNVDPLQSR